MLNEIIMTSYFNNGAIYKFSQIWRPITFP